jgi:hypothetical protein
MAWLIGDSFDFYAATADAAAGHWDSVGTSSYVQLETSNTRFSVGRALKGGSSGGSANPALIRALGSNEATLFVAVAFCQTAALGGTSQGLTITLRDGATAQCSIVFQSNGDILLRSAVTGSVLATYAGAFQQNVWAHFQFKVTIDNAAGAFTVRKNGATGDSFSAGGLNTRGGTANAYANAVALYFVQIVGVITQLIDDLLIYSVGGAAPNDWVGDIRAVQLLPSADTAQRDFSRSAGSANYALVDEAVQNGDADYVFSGTPGHQDLYDLGDLAATPASIVAVQARMFARKTDSGARSGQIRVKSGATDVGGADTVLSTSYSWLSRVDVTDPNTGVPWTAAAVNALQVGPKVTA